MKTRILLPIAALLYFSEGFPFGLINELVPIYLRQSGVSLTAIGLLSTVGYAWTLKFLWSPLIDSFGTYKRWIQASIALIALGLAGVAASGTTSMPLFWTLLTIIAIGSATQDMAIDAFIVRATPNATLGLVNSVRVAGYRVGMIVAGGALALIADRAGWRAVFIAAIVIALVILACTLLLGEDRGSRRAETSLFEGVRHWLAGRGTGALLAVILLYRLGDSLLTPMVKPFWIDQGYSATETGAVTTIAGMTLTILGALVGGLVMTRSGLYRGLLWLGLLQMLSNIGYAVVASSGTERGAMYIVAGIEQFCGGLGTAAFLGFLMAICDVEYAAVEYALLSAIFGFTRQTAGSFSGVLADNLGYSQFFWLTTFAALPGLLLLPFIRGPLEERERARAGKVDYQAAAVS